jgi:hypothetical protein
MFNVKMRVLITSLMLTATPALAVEIPSEASKILALKLAYQLNGNSMVRWGSIDLTVSGLEDEILRRFVPPPPVSALPAKQPPRR